MGKYKIGITERGDAGLDFSWENKLQDMDGAILITKNVNDEFIKHLMDQDTGKIVLHIGCTGYGGSILEPKVPFPHVQLAQAVQLIEAGFPISHTVVRVDPIIPSAKGIRKAQNVILNYMNHGFFRFRLSVLDMYKHVKKRFAAAGVSSPYGDAFSATSEQFAAVDAMVDSIQKDWFTFMAGLNDSKLRIESCAEPKLKSPIHCGCISAYDFKLMGLDPEAADGNSHQWEDCLCCSGKTELLQSKTRCPHQCLYCYWQDIKKETL